MDDSNLFVSRSFWAYFICVTCRCMKSDGCDPDTVTWNTVMDGYCRAGQCEAALQIFDLLVDPSVVSWTTIILGYSRSGNHEAALAFFRRMISESAVPPDHDTLSCALSSCRHLSALRTAAELHAYGLKAVPAPAFYRNAGAALLATYAGCSRTIAAAGHVFRMMDPTDAVTWNAVIAGFTDSGRHSAALDHFRGMQTRGIRSDQATLTTVLRACNLKLGREIHAHFVRNYYRSAISVHNALICMYSSSGCASAARAVFSSTSSPDLVSYNSMIKAYGSNGLGELAVQLVEEMDRTGVRPDGVTLTSVLTACSHSGLVHAGLGLFERFSRVPGLDLGVEHYATVVDLLGRAGRFKEAVRFIKRMPAWLERRVVWGALLAACQVHQNVESGRLVFDELVRIEPENPGNYVTMANLYAKEGRWAEAEMVRRLMEERGVVKLCGYSKIEIGEFDEAD